MENPQPNIFNSFIQTEKDSFLRHCAEEDQLQQDPIDSLQIFDIVRHINDPQYPLTLQQLNVVNIQRCYVESIPNYGKVIRVLFTPTIPHCSMAQTIGLMLRIKLQRSLPRQYKQQVMITPGTHNNQIQINKMLMDKQRVAAAVQNPSIERMVKKGVINSDKKPF